MLEHWLLTIVVLYVLGASLVVWQGVRVVLGEGVYAKAVAVGAGILLCALVILYNPDVFNKKALDNSDSKTCIGGNTGKQPPKDWKPSNDVPHPIRPS